MVKFSELKEKIEAVNPILINTVLEQLEIKQYIPIDDKASIVSAIGEQMIVEEDGFASVDLGSKELFTTFAMAKYYGGIIFDLNEEEKNIYGADEYDFLHENGVIKYIEEQTDDVWKFLQLLEDTLKNELEKRNSIASIAVRYLDKFMVKLDDLTDDKKMGKMVKQFEKAVSKNPVLLELLKDNIEQSKGVLKKVK
jgi:hypothetical protein